jgi:hypothetical protein
MPIAKIAPPRIAAKPPIRSDIGGYREREEPVDRAVVGSDLAGVEQVNQYLVNLGAGPDGCHVLPPV